MVYGLLGIIIIVLCVKIYLLKKSAREITDDFADRLKTDTNTPIGISSRDKDMRELADSINKQLAVLRREQLRYIQGDAELKTAVTNISHDLRTPLTAICGYLELMKEEEKSQKLSEYLDIIGGRAEAMKQLTEELFKYSVVMSEVGEQNIEEVLVNSLLEDCIMGFFAALNEKGVEPRVRITEKRITRNLDRADLSRVFSNLLANALKYSGGDLEISLDDDGVISFSNSAPQLDEVSVGRLFDRFYTVESASGSTGLGLSIAKTLVAKMHGEITAEFSYGRLCIKIFLPE
ncbi:MAG: sensor histidine kinase [Oscillospiraceae bacterium]